MKKNGVKKACVISAGGVGDSYHKVSFIMRIIINISALAHVFRLLEKMEVRYDEATDLDICIVRLPVLTDGPLTDKGRVVPNLYGNHTSSRADVAKWMIDESLKQGSFVVRKPFFTAV